MGVLAVQAGPLIEASAKGDLAEVTRLLSQQPELVNQTNADGRTALDLAAVGGHVEIVKELLAHKAEVANQPDPLGANLLMRVAVSSDLVAEAMARDWSAETNRIRILANSFGDGENLRSAFEDVQKLATPKTAMTPLSALLSPDGGPLPISPAHARAKLAIMRLLLAAGALPNATNQVGFTALHSAVALRDVAPVQALLEAGARTDLGYHGMTPLHSAAACGNVAAVRLLIDHKASVHSRTTWGVTPLYVAARMGRLEVVQTLSEHKGSLLAMANDGTEPLHAAAFSGHEAVVAFLLDQGAFIHSRNNEGATPLHLAASEGRLAVVKVLVDRKADLEASDDEGFTPLLNAAERGKSDVLGLLLQCGANVKHQTKNGDTALSKACENGNQQTVTTLLAGNAKSYPEGSSGQTLLHSAAQFGHPKIVELLLARGLPVNALNNAKLTPLFYAAAGPEYISLVMSRTVTNPKVLEQILARIAHRNPYGTDEDYRQVLELLIGKGANVSTNDALHAAVMCKHLAGVEVLLAHHAKVDATNHLGQQPIHVAAAFATAPIVEKLLLAGAPIEALDAQDFTPLNHAAGAGNMAVIQVLLNHQANINARRPPLHSAIQVNQVEAAKVLLAAHPKLGARDSKGRTPLQLAEELKLPDMVRLLKEHEAKERSNNAGQVNP